MKLQATEKSSAKATSLAFISFKVINSSRNLIDARMPDVYAPRAVGSPWVVSTVESISSPTTKDNLDGVA